MMTMTNPTLSLLQQSLIDARLDTIDRMLSGRVARAERQAIVREVESQIFELIVERDAASLTRDDIIDVLRRLDPPEAYLSDETETDFQSPIRTSVRQTAIPRPTATALNRFDGRIGGFAGIASFLLLFAEPLVFGFLSALDLSSEGLVLLLLATPAVLVLPCMIVSFVFSVRGRKQGALPIVGLVFAGISLPVWILAGLFVLTQL